MDLMEQCRIWNENEEYQTIINTIEALPEERRTPELFSELARAYNNIADPENPAGYRKAIELLKPYEEYFQGNHSWNFRLAYAYYYLDQEGPALHYFEQALEACPGDEDSKEFIDDCRSRLSLPRFDRPFRVRVAESWRLFEQGEGELRGLLDQRNKEAVGSELIAKCETLLSPAFADISFELGFNGEKYELILTPEGNRAKLFELTYFQRRAPKTILAHWNILVGRQPSGGFSLRLSDCDQTISADDVQVWIEQRKEPQQNHSIALTLYCEKLLPLLQEREGAAWWMLSTITDQVLGEIPAMAYIEGFEVVDTPKEASGISLSALPETLEAMGLDLRLSAEQYLENGYTAYQMEPNENPDADWRLDVIAGSTLCPGLINEYFQGKNDIMDAFHRDGAVPGFICYPLDSFPRGADGSKAVMAFRDALEAALLKGAGTDAVTLLGGASGIYCGYLDVLVWDLPPVLDAAAEFFCDSPIAWAGFHTFRRNVGTIRLKNRSDDGSLQPAED